MTNKKDNKRNLYEFLKNNFIFTLLGKGRRKFITRLVIKLIYTVCISLLLQH